MKKKAKESPDNSKKATAEIRVKKAPKIKGSWFLRLLGLLPEESKVETVQRESIFSRQQKAVVTPMTKLTLEPIVPDPGKVPRAETILPSNYKLIGRKPVITRPEPLTIKNSLKNS